METRNPNVNNMHNVRIAACGKTHRHPRHPTLDPIESRIDSRVAAIDGVQDPETWGTPHPMDLDGDYGRRWVTHRILWAEGVGMVDTIVPVIIVTPACD